MLIVYVLKVHSWYFSLLQTALEMFNGSEMAYLQSLLAFYGTPGITKDDRVYNAVYIIPVKTLISPWPTIKATLGRVNIVDHGK